MSKQAWWRHLRLGVMSIALVLVVVAVVAQALVGSKSGHANPDAVPTNNEYRVDADPATGGIQTTINVPTGSNFDVAWVISNTVDAWSAEQGTMQWDPGIVSFVSGPVDTNLGGATFCGGTTGADYVYWGCAIGIEDCGGACTGVTRTMTLRCDAPGTSALHLRTTGAPDNEGEGTGTNFALASGAVADPCQTGNCFDASVTCVGEAGPSPTPAGTPEAQPTAPTPRTSLLTAIPAPTGTALSAGTGTGGAGTPWGTLAWALTGVAVAGVVAASGLYLFRRARARR
jgi:hypothetical protein